MEVSTMSPSPASPTEGDDLCETDVTSVATHSVTLLICLCGLAGNGAVLCRISLKIANYVIFQLAVVNFLLLLFTVLSAIPFLVEDMSCSPIVPLMCMSFLFQLSVVSYYWALLWLMPTRPVVYMERLWKLCCRCEFPLHLWTAVGTVQYQAFFALFTVIPTVTFLCPSHEQEHCRAALISMYTLILLLFVAHVVISHTLDFIKAKWGSQQQQPKRHDIIIISIGFFTILFILCNFVQQLRYIAVPSHFFSCSPASTAATNPSSTSWQGGAGGPAPWGHSGSPPRGCVSSQKKTLPTEMIPPHKQMSKPVHPFHCTAEGPWDRG